MQALKEENIKVLSIDDDIVILQLIEDSLEQKGYKVITARSGEQGIKLFRQHHPNIVLVDLEMPGMNGMQVIENLKKESPETPTIIVSGNNSIEKAIDALRIGAWDYLVKPLHGTDMLEGTISKSLEKAELFRQDSRYKAFLEEEVNRRTSEITDKNNSLVYLNSNLINEMKRRSELEQNLQESLDNLKIAQKGIIQAISSIVEVRDQYTAGHQCRVALLAQAIAKEMGLSDYEIEGLYIAALLHDVGKIGIPSDILMKPGRLSEVEFAMIKTHCVVAYDILKNINFPWPIASIVLQHHEKMNGSGYPFGLESENIILDSRILCVADVCEAVMSHRPYRPALGLDVALDELKKNSDVLYDRKVANACTRVFNDNGFTF